MGIRVIDKEVRLAREMIRYEPHEGGMPMVTDDDKPCPSLLPMMQGLGVAFGEYTLVMIVSVCGIVEEDYRGSRQEDGVSGSSDVCACFSDVYLVADDGEEYTVPKEFHDALELVYEHRIELIVEKCEAA